MIHCGRFVAFKLLFYAIGKRFPMAPATWLCRPMAGIGRASPAGPPGLPGLDRGQKGPPGPFFDQKVDFGQKGPKPPKQLFSTKSPKWCKISPDAHPAPSSFFGPPPFNQPLIRREPNRGFGGYTPGPQNPFWGMLGPVSLLSPGQLYYDMLYTIIDITW